MGLPGGVTVTLPASGPERWSYPNLTGSVAAIADGSGAKVGDTYTYDPYGNALAGLPDNRTGNLDAGWLGAANTEHAAGTPTLIELGARLYSPLLGRFLEVDPVANGSANAYEYANADPINFVDPGGEEPWPLQYGADDYHQNLASCGYGGYTNCTQLVDPGDPDNWYNDVLETERKAEEWTGAIQYALAMALEWQGAKDYAEALLAKRVARVRPYEPVRDWTIDPATGCRFNGYNSNACNLHGKNPCSWACLGWAGVGCAQYGSAGALWGSFVPWIGNVAGGVAGCAGGAVYINLSPPGAGPL